MSVRALTGTGTGFLRFISCDVWVGEFQQLSNQIVEDVVTKPAYKAIWDTGATSTVINQKIVKALNLIPTGKAINQVVGVAGKPVRHEVNTYFVNLFLPNKVILPGLTVSEGEPGGCDVLIGMDVIRQGDFSISNANNRTVWSFRVPSIEETDYVKEIDSYNLVHRSKPLSSDAKRKARNKRKKFNQKKRNN